MVFFPPATPLSRVLQRADHGPSSLRPPSTPRRSGGRVFSPPSAADALVRPAPTPAPSAHPLPAGAKRGGAHNNSAGSCWPTHRARSPSTPGRLGPPGAPPASVLFFKLLQALVQLLTGHCQERLLQHQFHMRIGQRFFDTSQFA